jgi:hypothetical protein
MKRHGTPCQRWTLKGKPIGRLAKVMGHSETEVTERAHLRVDLFPNEDRQALAIDLAWLQNGYISYRW